MKKLSLENIELPTGPDFNFNPKTKELIESTQTAPIRLVDGTIVCGDNSGNNQYWFDYYGELQHGCTWIREDLEKWAIDNFGKNSYWEWENPEMLSLVVD
ncbi:MAG: hypothetical protein CL760_09515 [Chloroflexi bacterium]|nr:hypothetical protein [Chloroflexota bacterium]|tara:strand:- start:10007 stop:10306 length:300 start_codon:yes stop_codon:yes gene_type:complete